jgi:beta-mannosidase
MLSLALASCAALLSGAAASPLSTGSLGGSRTLSLAGSTKAAGGSPWTVRNHNGTLVLPATVPGVVHLDLLRAKKITEPYYRYGATATLRAALCSRRAPLRPDRRLSLGAGELELAWVYLEPSWTFARTIAAGALGATPGRVLLRSEGIDTVATVTLNGHLVGQTSNMFHRPVWDVTSAFKPAAENTLEVRIDSPALASSANRDAYPYEMWAAYATPLQYPHCGCEARDLAACFTDQHKDCDCLLNCKTSGGNTTRNYLRKSQAHWGWNWGAGFLTSGIYRELSLVSYEHGSVIRDVAVQIFPTGAAADSVPHEHENPTSTTHPTPTDFRVELDVFLISDVAQHTTIHAAIPSLGGATNVAQVNVAPGEQKVRVVLELTGVPKAALWFPNGYGDAVLHNLSVTVGDDQTHDAEINDASRWSKRIGLKTIEMVQQPLPPGLPGAQPGCSDYTKGNYSCAFQKADGKCNQSLSPWHVPLGRCCSTCFECSDACLAVNGEKAEPPGLSMVFRVNGIPVFIKGTNWVATDQFEPRIPQRKGAPVGGDYVSAGAGFDELLGAAKAANQNMIRVWGGGTYERDDFYDVADELGLLIWEEGKFACALYPRDKQFLESVTTEVEDQIRRLSHHASIAVYSGNNENMKQGQKGDQAMADYSMLYDHTIPTAIRAVDRSRPYWPASPSNGPLVDDPERGLFIQRWGDEKDSRYGDVHGYPNFEGFGSTGITIDCETLSAFQAARFVSEYGFISMESWASILSMTLPDDITADGNSSQLWFRMRQTWPHGQGILLGQLAQHYDMPTHPDPVEAYKDLTYLTQAVHAHCVTLSSAHYRLQRGSDSATMGLMFWSLNNQWQGSSDSAVDYTGRWKLPQHASVRYFAPIMLHLHSIGPGVVHIAQAGSQPGATSGSPVPDPEAVQTNTNVTTGIVNDTPFTGTANITLSLRSWATGEAVQSWNVRGPVPAYSSRNFSAAPVKEYLGLHRPETVFLTASASLRRAEPPEGTEGTETEAAMSMSESAAAAAAPGIVMLTSHHYPSKMKAATLRDPQVKLEFSENAGPHGEQLSVVVTCSAPAPHVFLDPGALLGHFSDNGMLLLPDQPRTLFFDDVGEPGVTMARLKAEVVVRSPWSTRRHH